MTCRGRMCPMKYDFLAESYDTERVKVLSVWSEFTDDDLPVRPRADDPRGRSVREHMVHQCVSEDAWFRTMLGIDVGAPPLPSQETRLEFMVLGRELHSNYGPTADTGGLVQNHAPTIYAYSGVDALLEGERRGGAKSPLPRATGIALTERPF